MRAILFCAIHTLNILNDLPEETFLSPLEVSSKSFNSFSGGLVLFSLLQHSDKLYICEVKVL